MPHKFTRHSLCSGGVLQVLVRTGAAALLLAMESHRATLIYVEGGSTSREAPAGRDSSRARGSERHGSSTPCSSSSHHHVNGKESGCHNSMGATFPLMMVGLATVICLLFISFGVLLCCYYKLLTAPQAAPSRAAADRTLFDTFNDALKESSSSQDEAAASSKEVVVIMAGNNTPTFVAFPAFVQESTSKQVPLA